MILAIAAAGLRPLGQVLEPNFVNFVLAIEKINKSSRDHDGESYKEEPIISRKFIQRIKGSKRTVKDCMTSVQAQLILKFLLPFSTM